MPTKRRRRARQLVPEISPAMFMYLQTGDLPQRSAGWAEVFQKSARGQGPALRAEWLVARQRLLDEWVEAHPGTRPWAWWHFDAPTSPVVAPRRPAHGALVAQRARVGGIGTPAYEVLNHAAYFRFGLPVCWVSPFDELLYNGRAVDIYGNRIDTEYREGDFPGLAPRRDDPPRFESQATFLERHDLLLAEEAADLSDEGFEPEAIVIPPDEPEDMRAVYPRVFATRPFDEFRGDEPC